MKARPRLLKVIVQPVFVLDDGEHLAELIIDPVVVPAADWPTYPTVGFAAAVEMLRSQFEDKEDSPFTDEH